MKTNPQIQPIRLIIIDDQTIFRQSLKLLLSEWKDIEVVGDTSCGRQGLFLIYELKPSLVITGIILSDMDGFDLIRQIKEHDPKVEILVLSMHKNPQLLFRAIKTGCRGYILKTEPADELKKAIFTVAKSRNYISPQIVADFINYCIQSADVSDCHFQASTLTHRESEICEHVVQGRSTDEMASDLFISPKTVRVHVANAMKKLSCHTRTELVLRLMDMIEKQSQPFMHIH